MRTLTLALLVVSLATLAGLAPGVARANDAGVAASVTKWSARIGPKAATLGTTMSGTSTTRALAGFRSFTKVARQGAAAISTTKPSTRRGAKLKLLATRAFVNFDDTVAERVSASDVVKGAAALVGGGGGGRRTMARAGGKDPAKLPDALAEAERLILAAL